MNHLALMQTILPFNCYFISTFFPLFFMIQGCPAGWVPHEASCFHVNDTLTLKWNDARTTCKGLAADLAIIKSATENNFIFDLIKKQQTVTGKGVWLGLYRKDDTKFYWIDDTPLGDQYSAWAIGEPNNQNNNEECVHLYGKGSKGGEWNDRLCSLDDNLAPAPVVLCQKANN